MHADDGASIVAANKEARKPEKAIDGDDDSYLKNSCSAQKWIIIELSQVCPEACQLGNFKEGGAGSFCGSAVGDERGLQVGWSCKPWAALEAS